MIQLPDVPVMSEIDINLKITPGLGLRVVAYFRVAL